MSDRAPNPPSIVGESVGKWFRLGERRAPYGMLSEAIMSAVRSPTRALRRGSDEDESSGMWALRDVSFELAPGDAVGLVGRNGSGKSTLLKILSRITPPTEGRITVRGRVGTLLEVGTGFHPELTGRENIYLNGAILGMRRREISARFDDIVEFAGVSRFLDTPVKRYSSGMHVRLAFAVAAHLDTDVLLVDEVLAVGDSEFQRKCLGKMRDVAGEGRVVVLVSHNMSAVQRLCNRAILLERGQAVMDGPTGAVIAEYLDRVDPDQSGGAAEVPADAQRIGSGEARLIRVAMLGSDGSPTKSSYLGQRIRLVLTFDVQTPIGDGVLEVGVSTMSGERIATAYSIDRHQPPLEMKPGIRQYVADMDATFMPGEFVVDAGLHHATNATIDMVERVLRFTALNLSETGDDDVRWVRGLVRPHTEWSELDAGRTAAAAVPGERSAP